MDEYNQDAAPAVPAVFVQIIQIPLHIPFSAGTASSLVVCVPRAVSGAHPVPSDG